MIYNTKHEFMEGLRTALAQNDVKDAREILIDFEQHFDDGIAAGESEAEICGKLGDVEELVKQYISEDLDAAASTANTAEAPAASTVNTEKTVYEGETAYGKTVYDAEPASGGSHTDANVHTGTGYTAGAADTGSTNNPDTSAIIIALCLDVFVYSWAIPTLFGLIMGLIGTTIGFAASGIAIFFAGVVGSFADMTGIISTGFAPVSLIFFGIMMMAFGGMLVIASIASVKGFVNLIIAIINQHAKAFTGRKLLNKIGKKKENSQDQKEAAAL